MLYKAFAYEKHGGKTMCGDPLAAVGDPDAETFSRKCQLIVRDESERDRAMSDGWAATPTKALPPATKAPVPAPATNGAASGKAPKRSSIARWKAWRSCSASPTRSSSCRTERATS